jgi:hypothetical protein
MLEASTNIFDQGVARFFKPLAESIKLPLRKPKEGIYEIAGSTFTMRIRRGIGHSRDFLICLSEKGTRPEAVAIDDLGGETGLGVIVEFYGEKLGVHALHTDEGYLNAFEEAAKAAEKFCVPYLLDLRSNFGEVRDFVERKIEASGARMKEYRFPPNVRKEWL